MFEPRCSILLERFPLEGKLDPHQLPQGQRLHPAGQRGRKITSSLSLMAASVKFLLSLSKIFLCSSRTFHSSLRLSFSCSMGQFPWSDNASSSHWELSCCCRDIIQGLDTAAANVLQHRNTDKLLRQVINTKHQNSEQTIAAT